MSAIPRGSRRARRPGPVGQDRTAVVGAFGVPSVACDREKAGTEGPVLARNGHTEVSWQCPLLGEQRKTCARFELFRF